VVDQRWVGGKHIRLRLDRSGQRRPSRARHGMMRLPSIKPRCCLRASLPCYLPRLQRVPGLPALLRACDRITGDRAESGAGP
jgi:hypothetical protein